MDHNQLQHSRMLVFLENVLKYDLETQITI